MLTQNNVYGGFFVHSFTFYFLLFRYRIPFQQSGYIPLEAGKYYWIEALHKEGARRDSLSVGYTLECPNAPSVLSEKPILKPSLQHKIPSKCCCSSVLNVLSLAEGPSRAVEKESEALVSVVVFRFCCLQSFETP